MKLALVLSFLSAVGFAKTETILDCRAVKVIEQNNPWEEGFSTHEYPEVRVQTNRTGSADVHVGSALLWNGEYDLVQVVRNTKNNKIIRFSYNHSDQVYTIRAQRNDSGKLVAKLFSVVDASREKLIGIAYCK